MDASPNRSPPPGAPGNAVLYEPRPLPRELSAINQELRALRPRLEGIDASRGQPPPEVHDLSDGKLLSVGNEEIKRHPIGHGTRVVDLRNYTGPDLIAGLSTARVFFGNILGEPAERTLVWNHSSLELLAHMLRYFDIKGPAGDGAGWRSDQNGQQAIMVSVPAYDRHIRLLEANGYAVIGVKSRPNGPDLNAMEALAVENPRIRGAILTPRFSNPEGWTMQPDEYLRLASLRARAENFVVVCDDAYCVHHLDGPVPQLPDLITASEEAGNRSRIWRISSTSKITYSGGGVAWTCASKGAVENLGKFLLENTIRPGHVNQLQETRFLSNVPGGLTGHMNRCAAILAPRFEAMTDALKEHEIPVNAAIGGGFSCGRPIGGYFIPVKVKPGTAQRVVELMKELVGVTITDPSGCYPKGFESKDDFLRMCPSRLSPDQSRLVGTALALCVEYAATEKVLANEGRVGSTS